MNLPTSHPLASHHTNLLQSTSTCPMSPQPASYHPNLPTLCQPTQYQTNPSHITWTHPIPRQAIPHQANSPHIIPTMMPTHSPMQPSPQHLPPSHPTQAISILSRGGTMPTWNSTIPMYCAALGAPVLSLCPTTAIHPTLQHLPGCT